MAKFTTQPFNPSQRQTMDIAGIIAAPLVAAAEANAMMAREQVKFLMDFCFYERDGAYEPVKIRMVLTRARLEPAEEAGMEPRIQRVTSTFELPLITIVPFSSLAVESMEVNFNVEVSTYQKKSTDDDMESQEPLLGTAPALKLVGRVASRRSSPGGDRETSESTDHYYEVDDSASLEIRIQSGSLPLPVGLTSLLNLYSGEMSPTRVESVSGEPCDSRRQPRKGGARR